MLRRDDTAIGELQDGVARWRATGARLVTPYWTYMLASALDTAGRSTEALTTADDALTQLHGSDERWFEPELYVLKGSLMARARPRGAEAMRGTRRTGTCVAPTARRPSWARRRCSRGPRTRCARSDRVDGSRARPATSQGFLSSLSGLTTARTLAWCQRVAPTAKELG